MGSMKTEVIAQIENNASAVVRALKPSSENLLPWVFRIGGSFSPKLFARAIEEWFQTPRKFEAPEAEAAFMRSAHRFSVPFEGKLLAAWSWGQGPTVFLVHGWSGRGGQMFPFVKPLVEAGYSVVTFDAPAHGLSEGKITNMVEMSRAVHTVVNWCGPAEAIIAHSVGSAASAFAMKHGMRVKKLVFIGAPCSPDNFTRGLVETLGMPRAAERELIKRMEVVTRSAWEDLSVASAALAMRNGREEGLNVPLLIFHDEQDRDVPVSEAQAISDAWPHSVLIRTDGLGHRKILRAPEVIAEAVSFVRDRRA